MKQRFRGLFFVEVIPTLALVGIALSMAAVLLGRAWKLDRRIAETDACDRAAAHFINTLRHDLKNANQYEVIDQNNIKIDNTITYKIGPAKMMRADPKTESVTGMGDTRFRFEQDRIGLIVVGENPNADIIRRRVVIPEQWAKEAFKP